MENNIVKNAELLNLAPAQLATLTTRAEMQRRFAAIDFKVLEVKGSEPPTAVIRIRQTRSHAENYFDLKRLVEILHETVGDLLSGWRIEARPIPYRPSPPDVVDADWLQRQRGQRPIKEIAHDLGLDANNVSALIRGIKPLSGVTRAMFYYYFNRK